MHIRRVIMGLVATMIASVGLIVAAAPAQAHIVCGGRTHHWSVKSGSVWIKVAWVELHVNVCTNGGQITTSTASVDSDETGPGTTAGFKVHAGTPYITSFDGGGFAGGHVGWSSNDTLRDCLPGGITVWCSYTYHFRIHATVSMLNQLYVATWKPNQILLHGRVFEFHWSWKCTDDKCQVRLS